MPAPTRLRADACPGVLATHDAADGPLARVRLPGGALTGDQARVLAACAEDLGDGTVHLTSRANLQLRAIRDVDELVTRLSAAGLLPAPGHERVRNILGSPLSGLHGGRADIRPLVSALDRAICARPELARLPGRFLFALDDGRGDVAAEAADLCWRALGEDTGAVLVDGAGTAVRVPTGQAVAALAEAAVAFVRTRGDAWRVRETDPAPVLDALHPFGEPFDAGALPCAGPPPLGAVAPGVVVAAPRFGQVTGSVLRSLGDLVVTPWRTLVLTRPDAADRPDLVTDPAEPSLGVSACIGSPGCARSRADVRADARGIHAAGVTAHVAGCERRCGRPRGPHVDVVATGGGYRVDGAFVTVERLAEALIARKGHQ